MTLAETQALFHEILTGPDPVAPDRIDACFAGTPELPATERVAIYANMYLWRLTEALRETFPKLLRYLGDDRFAALAEDYVRRNPSEHHDIGQVGRRLARFLRQHPDPDRPDLADLADLEWARHQVFFAPPADPVGPEAFTGLAPDAFARTSLVISTGPPGTGPRPCRGAPVVAPRSGRDARPAIPRALCGGGVASRIQRLPQPAVARRGGCPRGGCCRSLARQHLRLLQRSGRSCLGGARGSRELAPGGLDRGSRRQAASACRPLPRSACASAPPEPEEGGQARPELGTCT